MEYKKNSDTYEKIPGDDAKRRLSQNKDVRYSDPQGTEEDRTQYSVEIDDSDPGASQWCTWKVTAIVFIALSVLLLITVLTVGGIWLRESDNLAVSQKTSMEGVKQHQEEEEQKRMERERMIRTEEEQRRVEREREIRAEEEQKREEKEREIREEEKKKRIEREQEIRAEEEQKRVEREREIRAEEGKKRAEREQEIREEEEKKRMALEQQIREEEEKRVALEQQIRGEEEEKRQALEKLLGERERRLEEMRAQCNSAQIISISSTGLGVLLPLLLLLNSLIVAY